MVRPWKTFFLKKKWKPEPVSHQDFQARWLGDRFEEKL